MTIVEFMQDIVIGVFLGVASFHAFILFWSIVRVSDCKGEEGVIISLRVGYVKLKEKAFGIELIDVKYPVAATDRVKIDSVLYREVNLNQISKDEWYYGCAFIGRRSILWLKEKLRSGESVPVSVYKSDGSVKGCLLGVSRLWIGWSVLLLSFSLGLLFYSLASESMSGQIAIVMVGIGFGIFYQLIAPKPASFLSWEEVAGAG